MWDNEGKKSEGNVEYYGRAAIMKLKEHALKDEGLGMFLERLEKEFAKPEPK